MSMQNGASCQAAASKHLCRPGHCLMQHLPLGLLCPAPCATCSCLGSLGGLASFFNLYSLAPCSGAKFLVFACNLHCAALAATKLQPLEALAILSLSPLLFLFLSFCFSPSPSRSRLPPTCATENEVCLPLHLVCLSAVCLACVI